MKVIIITLYATVCLTLIGAASDQVTVPEAKYERFLDLGNERTLQTASWRMEEVGGAVLALALWYTIADIDMIDITLLLQTAITHLISGYAIIAAFACAINGLPWSGGPRDYCYIPEPWKKYWGI